MMMMQRMQRMLEMQRQGKPASHVSHIHIPLGVAVCLCPVINDLFSALFVFGPLLFS